MRAENVHLAVAGECHKKICALFFAMIERLWHGALGHVSKAINNNVPFEDVTHNYLVVHRLQRNQLT